MNPTVLESRQKLGLIFCLLLVLATIALYNPISRAPFLNYDDDYYIILNSHVRAGLTWSSVSWAFRSTELSNWHPITWLSHALDVQVFGLNPAGHHYTNVLLHALNVVLLFLFLERSTRMIWRSLIVAMLFAIHPINVESVAWISERKNLLSMNFFLLGLLVYLWYAQKPGIRRYALLAGCFAAGLMAKPQVITFPFVLLLIDYWPLQRMNAHEAPGETSPGSLQPRPGSFSRLLLEKLPFLALSAASAVVTMKVQIVAMHEEFPLSVRLANALLAYVTYLRKAIWPTDLAPLYPYPGFAVSSSHAFLAALGLMAITVAVVLSRRRRYLMVGWFWFLGTLVPMIGLVQVGVQATADRYAYIPLIGLFIAGCWGLADFLQARHAPAPVSVSASVFVVLLLALVAHRQIGYWQDNLNLWTHTLEVTSNNFVAEDNVALALVNQGKPEDAKNHFESATRINPEDPLANLDLGVYEQERGNYLAAIQHFDRALQLTTNPRLLTSALTDRGSADYALKRYDDAERSFDAALQCFPENSQAMIGIGLLAERAGDFTRAAGEYARSLQFQPTDVGYLLLATALESNGQTEAARVARAQAERISPNLYRASVMVSQLLAK